MLIHLNLKNWNVRLVWNNLKDRLTFTVACNL